MDDLAILSVIETARVFLDHYFSHNIWLVCSGPRVVGVVAGVERAEDMLTTGWSGIAHGHKSVIDIIDQRCTQSIKQLGLLISYQMLAL